jgi:deoxyribodipyrimidine photo-lyase
MAEKVNEKRIFLLKQGVDGHGAVVYWMSREQRVNDNWSLIYAQQLAKERKVPLIVVFCLVKSFLNAAFRQYKFMVDGLKQIETDLKTKNIPFYLLLGNPEQEISDFLNNIKASALVTDFDPLKIKKKWKNEVAKRINILFYEVDSHNICPCRHVSNKQEFAARTIRPKIHRNLQEFLTEFPQIEKQMFQQDFPENNWQNLYEYLNLDNSAPEITWLKSGESFAKLVLDDFINNKLERYDELKNDPTKDVLSNLSPYLHFGQISAQRATLEVSKSDVKESAKDVFLEELIVRKELSDNYCFYNENYDNFEGFHDWAKKTLNEHRHDEREYLYSLEEFENAKTHDNLWNASQTEMLKTGKMHGYMRMYWCKKILEWTKSPEDAIKIAIYLNDKYSLDGRDSNGYVGIAWSIGGVHDRAWFNRDVFGKIRYMNYNGCKSKFDVDAYISKLSC